MIAMSHARHTGAPRPFGPLSARRWRPVLALGVAMLAGVSSYPLSASGQYGPMRTNPRVATSPAGTYHIVAATRDPTIICSPDWVEYPHSFAYTLTDLRTRSAVWTRREMKDERPPQQLFVDDDGTVVVWAEDRFGTDLILLDRHTGKRRLKSDPARSMPRFGAGRYRVCTSAGWQWVGPISMRFVHRGRWKLFVVSFWVGGWIILDTQRATVVPECIVTRPLLDNDDRDRALDVLRQAATYRRHPAGEEVRSDSLPDDLEWAAYVSGRLRVKGAIPLLRTLEPLDVISDYTMGGWELQDHLRNGEINPFCYTRRRLRQIIQLSLRRLGVKPACYPVTSFDPHPRALEIPVVPSPMIPRPDRAGRAGLVRPGMKPAEVLRILGAPDYVADRGWEYELDTPSPVTLLIRWNPVTVRVAGAERIWPAEWVAGARDWSFR